jgi:hypothetical protein
MAAETFERIQADVKTAMRAKDRERTTALRMLVSVLKNKQIDLRRDLTEEDILGVLSTEAKKRREAAQAYRDGGRDELADKEASELELIEVYLPQQLSDDEVAAMVTEVIAQVGAETKRDMGKVMGKMMPRIKGRFEGSKLKDIVLAQLG